jgi:hypothetical protein
MNSSESSQNKRIGILGSGEVGRTLGAGFIKYGHRVMLEPRDPKKAAIEPAPPPTSRQRQPGAIPRSSM